MPWQRSLSTADPQLTHDSLGPSEPTTQTASRSVQPFSHWGPQSVPILYNGTSVPPQNCPFPLGDLEPRLIHGSLGPPSPQPNGISIAVAVFAGLTSVTDRPTDRPTNHATRSVTIGRINVRSGLLRCGLIIIITSGQSNLRKAASPPPMDGIRYTLQWATPSSLIIAPSHGDLDPHLIHRSLGPPSHPSPQPKGNLDRFSRCCRAHVRDRQTDGPRSVS